MSSFLREIRGKHAVADRLSGSQSRELYQRQEEDAMMNHLGKYSVTSTIYCLISCSFAENRLGHTRMSCEMALNAGATDAGMFEKRLIEVQKKLFIILLRDHKLTACTFR